MQGKTKYLNPPLLLQCEDLVVFFCLLQLYTFGDFWTACWTKTRHFKEFTFDYNQSHTRCSTSWSDWCYRSRQRGHMDSVWWRLISVSSETHYRTAWGQQTHACTRTHIHTHISLTQVHLTSVWKCAITAHFRHNRLYCSELWPVDRN